MNSYFFPAKISLPRFAVSTPWSVIACDQYTSEPSYWEETNRVVGENPSTLHLVFPELYLGDGRDAERIADINDTMQRYLSVVLTETEPCYLYVERTLSDGRIRRGLMGLIDLEQYDFTKGAKSPVRATEETVLSRIPPRVKIRENAALELPHVMLLFDDIRDNMFSKLSAEKTEMACAYDFDLMQNGGHIAGYFVPQVMHSFIDDCIADLQEHDGDSLVFAVGDGNHSLATAKQCYENLKKKMPEEEAKTHPARYALVELTNIHDAALTFEPIYRVLFHVNPDDVVNEMQAYFAALQKDTDEVAEVTVLIGSDSRMMRIPCSRDQLVVRVLQVFLDDYLAKHPKAAIDYIHGVDSVKALASGENAVGFMFDGMGKEDLFPVIRQKGTLPRKTFSMGEADDKRFYLECRKIR